MSQFIVSARKYRPTKFSDVLGQDHISHTLKMAFSQDKLAHAFLFTGPRGVGKTTCARILAKTLNCLDLTKDYEPCGKCESCTSFDENASFSIFELDAASNNSVDHIRSLNEQVRIPPLSGKYKVFIIDEVHMLSSSAFNAFLKTLEEPSPYAIFILATTEKHKVLPTILSRCQIFDFRRLQISDIVKQLKIIAAKENIQTEEEALHLIATKADGAMRDALSIFDRIAGANNSQITFQAVTENLNVLDYTYYFRVFDALITEDLSQVLLILDDIIRKGFDPEIILTGFSEHLRQLLVCKDHATINLIENTEVIRQKYATQADLATVDYLLTCLDLCNECDIYFRTARNKRLHLEMTLIKMVYLRRVIESGLPEIAEDIEKKKPLTSLTANSNPLSGTNEKATAKSASLNENESAQIPSALLNAKKSGPPATEPGLLSSADLNADLKNEKASVNKWQKFQQEAKTSIQNEQSAHSAFTREEVNEIWQEYAKKATDTVRLVMQSREISGIDGEVIKFNVASAFDRETLINEAPLLESLRHNLKNRQIRLECTVDPGLLKEEQNKPRSSKEKYDLLASKNPAIQSLFEKLDLRIDE